MAYFYQHQRVRIVNATWPNGETFPEMVGRECTLIWATHANSGLNSWIPAWATDIPHPRPSKPGNPYCVLESQIEPLQYDFDKEEEEELELVNVPEFVYAR